MFESIFEEEENKYKEIFEDVETVYLYLIDPGTIQEPTVVVELHYHKLLVLKEPSAKPFKWSPWGNANASYTFMRSVYEEHKRGITKDKIKTILLLNIRSSIKESDRAVAFLYDYMFQGGDVRIK